jgi:fucose 4-O-acetylase-like acetyltransferase
VSAGLTSSRIPYYDNARFLLIALVVVGHAVEPAYEQVPLLRHLHLAIYSFHIPVLALLSGIFARRARRGVLRDVTGLLVPYLVFQVLYSAADTYAGGRDTFSVSLLTPTFLTWYLLSLFCWRWLVRVFDRIPLSIPLAFAAGIAVGYLEPVDYRLSLSRTVVFFPFFLIGVRWPRDLHLQLATGRTRVAAGLFLVLMFVELAWWDPRLDPTWLYGGYPYSGILTGPLWLGGLLRAGFYALACVAGVAFLCLVPVRWGFYTVWGARSLGAYLLHGLLVKGCVGLGLYQANLDRPWAQAALVTAAVAITMLLSSRPAFVLARALGGQPWLDRIVSRVTRSAV